MCGAQFVRSRTFRDLGSVRGWGVVPVDQSPVGSATWGVANDAVCPLVSGRRSGGGLAAGESLRGIANRLGRASSTVSREVASNGGRRKYRAHDGASSVAVSSRRPKPAKLATNHRLREVVEEKLEGCWSPLQISRWLYDVCPSDEEMRVSDETIYQSLFIQGKEALRKELWRCLHTSPSGSCLAVSELGRHTTLSRSGD